LIDPLNPLGSGYPPEEVRAIAEIAKDHGLWLLNDVTYRDFAERPTLAYPYHPEKTLTVWSVSKNCGLAGMRIGGLAAAADVAKTVGRYNTNDLGVNILAQVAALADLTTKSTWIEGVRTTTRRNQETIRTAVEGTNGTFLPVYPSQANMFAIDISATGIAPERLQETLLKDDGVFVRAGNYLSPKFGGRFVRASFSNPPEDVERFARAFPAAVDRLRASAVTPRAA
jgi:aspartate aminotransferase